MSFGVHERSAPGKWEAIMDSFLNQYYLAKNRNQKISVNHVPELHTPAQRIGYIVATCSPVTRAHIELAVRALDEASLDEVYFIIWPFIHIHGFHAFDVKEWAKHNNHIDWETRVHLLKTAIADAGMEERLKVLHEAKYLYAASKAYFDSRKDWTYFWTGTWYVIRALQASLGKREYFFIAGADQFNPNVYALFEAAEEKVWRDYNIAEQLALHSIIAAPRNGYVLERFYAPSWLETQVHFIGTLKYATTSATAIRTRRLQPEELLLHTYPSVVKYITKNHLWGY